MMHFEQMIEGAAVNWSHTISASEVDAFVTLSGDDNLLHTNDTFARQFGFRGRVVHGILLESFVSRVLGTMLPGPGVLWLSQETRFIQPAYIGDQIEITVRVKHRSEVMRTLVLEIAIHNQAHENILSGEAKMMLQQNNQSIAWTDMTAIVTGSSRGIGASIAEALGEK